MGFILEIWFDDNWHSNCFEIGKGDKLIHKLKSSSCKTIPSFGIGIGTNFT